MDHLGEMENELCFAPLLKSVSPGAKRILSRPHHIGHVTNGVCPRQPRQMALRVTGRVLRRFVSWAPHCAERTEKEREKEKNNNNKIVKSLSLLLTLERERRRDCTSMERDLGPTQLTIPFRLSQSFKESSASIVYHRRRQLTPNQIHRYLFLLLSFRLYFISKHGLKGVCVCARRGCT